MYLFNKKDSATDTVSPDRRGVGPSANKISAENITRVRNFLEEFPKFKSHYSNNDRAYFSSKLTWKKIFQEFQTKFPDIRISMRKFMQVVNDYNVAIYIPKKRIDHNQNQVVALK